VKAQYERVKLVALRAAEGRQLLGRMRDQLAQRGYCDPRDATILNRLIADLDRIPLVAQMEAEIGSARKIAHKRRSSGGKTTGGQRTIDRDARIDDIRRMAAEIRRVEGEIKDVALAALIVERRGLGEGVQATKKLLKAKKSTEKVTKTVSVEGR
jgi:hypothetical protein